MTRFSGMTFRDRVNSVPSFSADIYTGDSNIQDLIKADVPFRITTTETSDGLVEFDKHGQSAGEGKSNGAWEVITGFLNEPARNEKAPIRNDSAVIYRIDGGGMEKEVEEKVYDANNTISGTAKDVIQDDTNSIINTVSDLSANTIDTGPSSLQVKLRQDEALGLLHDIAQIGDGTDKFTYYISAVANDASSGDFTPAINYLSSTNSLFETSDPTGGTDSARVLEADTELRRFTTTPERKRVVNAVQVQYTGIGTGTGAQSTSFATDSTSIGNYDRQERIIYAPWLQNSNSATTLRDTVLDMYKGSATDGIERGEADLRDSQLFTGDFDAILGDHVAIKRSGGGSTVINDTMLAYEYDQSRELTTVTVGIPRSDFQQRQAATTRRQRQSLNSFEVTESKLSTETTQDSQDPGDNVLSSALSSASIGPSSTNTQDFSISTPNDFDATHIWYTIMNLNISSPHDGPAFVKVAARDSGAASETTIFRDTWHAMPDTAEDNTKSHCFPFAPTESTIDTIRVTIENKNDLQTLDVSSSSSVAVRSRSEHDIDLSHRHNF